MATEAQKRASKKYRDSKKGKESDKNRHKRYYSSGKGKQWLRYNRYGITQDEYEDMYNEQKGCCYICKKHKSVLSIDHNHSTGEVRRLLCKPCNTALGMVYEDITILREMIKYLNKKKY